MDRVKIKGEPEVLLRAASEEHFSMDQSCSSQEAVKAIQLQDRVIEKSIRCPPVGRFGAGVLVFLLFT